MARQPGEKLRPMYQKVLRLHCESVKGGQETIAAQLEMTRKTFNRAINSRPVDTEYLNRISAYVQQVIREDPDIVEAVFKTENRYVMPQVRISKIIESATPFPRETCQRIAVDIWNEVLADL